MRLNQKLMPEEKARLLKYYDMAPLDRTGRHTQDFMITLAREFGVSRRYINFLIHDRNKEKKHA